LSGAVTTHRSVPARVRRTTIRAWGSDGSLVGYVKLRLDPEHDDDADLLNFNVFVRSDYRRRGGVGSHLLAHVVPIARADGRTRLTGRSYDRVAAGGTFASAAGAVVAWDGVIPGKHLLEFVDLMLVMNDAPRDHVENNDFTLTPERWRQAERQNGLFADICGWLRPAMRVATIDGERRVDLAPEPDPGPRPSQLSGALAAPTAANAPETAGRVPTPELGA